MRRPLALALVAVLALGALAACGDDDDSDEAGGFEEAAELTPAEMEKVVGGVCDAAGTAATSVEAAEPIFGRAHDGLHSIARQLEGVDRGVAATLLKAKEQVESDFASTAPSDAASKETLRTDLIALAGAAGSGVKLLAPSALPPACG